MPRFYSNPGYTKKVEEQLAPYIINLSAPDIVVFDGAPKEVMLEVAKFLPEGQMEDRQNFSPTLGELLRDPYAVAYSGYIVRAVREDERLTVDAVYYPATVEGLRRALEVQAAYEPDGWEEVELADHTRAVMLWWD